MSLVWLTLLLIFAALLKFQFAISASSDEWFTHWRMYRSKTGNGSYYVDDSIQQGFAGSPRFYYKLLSLFDEKNWKLIGDLLNILWDLLSILVLFFVAKYFIAYELFNIVESNDQLINIDILLIFTLISYSTAPLLNPITDRLKGTKARTFSNFLIILTFAFLYIAMINEYYLATIPTIILGVITILSTAFGAQFLIFTLVSLSAFYLSWVPIIILTCIIILAYNKKVGGYFVIRHKLNHFKWYLKNYKGTTADRNNISDLLKFKHILKNPKFLIDQFFTKNSYLILLFNVPVITLVLWEILSNEYYSSNFALLQFLSTLVIIGTIAFFITSLNKFLFLGQAERYFEYILFPVYLIFHLVIYLKFDNSLYFHSGLVIWNLTITLINKNKSEPFSRLNRYYPDLTFQNNSGFDEIANLLNKGEEKRNILTVPFKLSFKLSSNLYNPEKLSWYYMFISNSSIDGFRYMSQDTKVYNYPTESLSYYEQKYNINTVILLNEDKNSSFREEVESKETNFEKVFSNEIYLIYFKRNN